MSVASQPLKPVARWYSQITQDSSGVELIELSLSYFPYPLRTRPPGRSSGAAVIDILGTVILE